VKVRKINAVVRRRVCAWKSLSPAEVLSSQNAVEKLLRNLVTGAWEQNTS